MQINNFQEEISSVWSFPKRGSWATHSSCYRGNFAPQIARNIILKFSKEGDVILDPMVGGGTSLIESKLLNRKGIGLDINPEAIKLTEGNLKFTGDYKYTQEYRIGDMRNLENIDNNSINLIITHPPYANIIKYSRGLITEDLSNINDINIFLDELEKGINEMYRVLKEDSYCAVLIGDTRKNRHYVPLSFFVMERFLQSGFILKEDIIKIQHNCSSSPYWINKVEKLGIYMIKHEHLFIFRKPKKNEGLESLKYSIIKRI